jgi:outer membrane protein assembly factor BamB
MLRDGRSGLRVLLVLCGVLCLATAALAGNWPRFRGPNGTGTAEDKDIPVTFSDTQGVLWKTALPGHGNSSPIIWGDRLFVQSATEDAKERMLLCLDVKDGKVLWSKSMPGSRAALHKKSSYASSTPATDGERVYALFWDGKGLALHAFDFQGNALWKCDLGAFSSQHGAGASPMICQDKVILNNDQDGSAALVAVDAKTGKIAWEAKRPAFRTCYSTPFLLEKTDAGPQLIVSSTAGITSYNPQTGAENWNWVWTFNGMALRTVGSPITAEGLIIATSGDGSGLRHMVAVKAGGKGDVTHENLAWENKRDFPYVPTMLTSGENLYFVTDAGLAGCCTAKSGIRIWSERLSSGFSASPVLIDGKVYACAEDGDVFVFPATPSFALLAKNSLGEPIAATPAVANHRLYIRGKDHLFCIGKPQ